MKNRQKNLLKHAKKAGHNAIVALDPENLFYMTGFWGEAIGVLDSSGAKIIAPALEASRQKLIHLTVRCSLQIGAHR